jgi:hypothetical protein
MRKVTASWYSPAVLALKKQSYDPSFRSTACRGGRGTERKRMHEEKEGQRGEVVLFCPTSCSKSIASVALLTPYDLVHLNHDRSMFQGKERQEEE